MEQSCDISGQLSSQGRRKRERREMCFFLILDGGKDFSDMQCVLILG